jgi:hypothetical protein
MRHIPALAVLVLVLVLAGSLASAAGAGVPPSLLPLAEDNRWVLRDVERGGTQTVSVARGPAGLVLRGLVGAGELRVRAAGRSVEAWDSSARRWEPFLQLGGAAGTSYTVDLAGTTLWRSLVVTVASRTAVVHDGRGKTLRNCVRLTFRARKPIADAGLEELVLAPGVGIARTSEQTIAGLRVRVLTSLRLSES